MFGRSTYKLTWEEIVGLCRLTSSVPPHNMRPRFNVHPTAAIDTIVSQDGARDLALMRSGLVKLAHMNGFTLPALHCKATHSRHLRNVGLSCNYRSAIASRQTTKRANTKTAPSYPSYHQILAISLSRRHAI